jgi:hypothetical protein
MLVAGSGSTIGFGGLGVATLECNDRDEEATDGGAHRRGPAEICN